MSYILWLHFLNGTVVLFTRARTHTQTHTRDAGRGRTVRRRRRRRKNIRAAHNRGGRLRKRVFFSFFNRKINFLLFGFAHTRINRLHTTLGDSNLEHFFRCLSIEEICWAIYVPSFDQSYDRHHVFRMLRRVRCWCDSRSKWTRRWRRRRTSSKDEYGQRQTE